MTSAAHRGFVTSSRWHAGHADGGHSPATMFHEPLLLPAPHERLASWPRPQVERILADGQWGVAEFSSAGGLGKNGTGYNMRYCWIIHVVDDRVVEVVGYYDTQTVTALFA
jgi:ketosteroid isomerase-like protein